MKNHEKIEIIVTTVCGYYGVVWQHIYKREGMRLYHPKWNARSVVLLLARDFLSANGAHEFLMISKPTETNILRGIIPDAYHRLKTIVKQKIENNGMERTTN